MRLRRIGVFYGPVLWPRRIDELGAGLLLQSVAFRAISRGKSDFGELRMRQGIHLVKEARVHRQAPSKVTVVLPKRNAGERSKGLSPKSKG